MRRLLIGVVGGSSCSSEEAEWAATVGRLLAEHGAVLLCGGLGGVMEAAARGAQQAGGLTVGMLPGAGAIDSCSGGMLAGRLSLDSPSLASEGPSLKAYLAKGSSATATAAPESGRPSGQR